jgi:phosphoenolpyruvate carboxylase
MLASALPNPSSPETTHHDARPSPETPARRAKENERPLVEDIRLLGRILGDVIREQEGVEAFELVERIRKLSVAFRRDADHEADRALKSLLKTLSGDEAVRVIRAFTYFSHLANLAEDRHHIRRRLSARARRRQRRKAASRWRWRACAGPASRRARCRRRWPTATSRRC